MIPAAPIQAAPIQAVLMVPAAPIQAVLMVPVAPRHHRQLNARAGLVLIWDRSTAI